MPVIRVDTDFLRRSSGSINHVGEDLHSVARGILQAIHAAPSYNGQFGPRVASMGAEGHSRASALGTGISSLSDQLRAKADAFQLADQLSEERLGGLWLEARQASSGVPSTYALTTGLPLRLIAGYLRLGQLLQSGDDESGASNPPPWWLWLPPFTFIAAAWWVLDQFASRSIPMSAPPQPEATATASATPTTIPSPTPTPSPTPRPTEVPSRMMYLTESDVHAREAPGLGSQILMSLAAGTGVLVTGERMSQNNLVWAKAEVQGREVWIAENYLRTHMYPGIGDQIQMGAFPFDTSAGLASYDGFGNTQLAMGEDKCDWYANTSGMHGGLDFFIPYNTELLWTGNGAATVLFASGKEYGAGPQSIVLQSGDFVFVYGHTSSNKAPLVQEGDVIMPGTPIGYSGNPDPNGRVDAGNDHLHLEVRPVDDRSIVINPVGLFPTELRDHFVSAVSPGYPEGHGPLDLGYFVMRPDPTCPQPP